MALNGTMVKIDTVTVGSGGAASIQFLDIPQTYTDLMIKVSARNTSTENAYRVRINNDSSSIYSARWLLGNGSAASSNNNSSQTAAFVGRMSLSTDTASTFGSTEIYIPNYTSSTSKSISSDVVTENNGTTAFQSLFAALYTGTAAITRLDLIPDANSFAQHTTATLYGISRTTAQIKATGGMVYDDADYVYHLFTSSGTFTPTQALTCEYLVVAGGGGGGRGDGNYGVGGGGAGGYRSSVSGELTGGGGAAETPLSLLASTSYTVTVGAGGNGATTNGTSGSVGSNSIFATITSTGGGGGASGTSSGTAIQGGTGGSGGGSAHWNFNGTRVGGDRTTSPVQGNLGGSVTSTGGERCGGGGGGAGVAGGNGNFATAGAGGNGLSSSITGSSVTRAGGGGAWGSASSGTSGGTGGGGNGSPTTSGVSGGAGTVNTGSGGGASFQNANGGAGGSGVVIVRYAK
jgi:hypothetical protein